MKDNVFISEWGPLNQDKLGGILSAKYTKKEVIEARYNAIEILQLWEEELYKSYRETLEKYRIQNFDPFPVGIPSGVIAKIVESMLAGFHFHTQYYHPQIPNPQMFLKGLRRDKLITDKDKRILNVWIKRGKE